MPPATGHSSGIGDGVKRGRVLVVGAGLAGLTTAFELRQHGIDTTVLEARDRVGGRVLTWRFPDGQHAEAGGEHIGTAHHVLRSYARRFGLGLDDLRGVRMRHRAAVFRRGALGRQADLYTPTVRGELGRYQALLDLLADQIDVEDPRSAALDDLSVADLLELLRIGPTAREIIEHRLVRDEYGVEARELSLLLVAAHNEVDPDLHDFDEAAFRIHGGNDRLTNAFASALEGAVHVGTPVERIRCANRGVEVSAGRRTFRGELCVVAAPLPALRAVDFVPALAPRLAAALTGLQYGVGAKTALRYRDRFWTAAGYGGTTFTDLPLSTTWEATNAQPGPAGILLAYTMGDPGRRFSELGDEARVAQTASELERIYPGSRGLLESTRTIAWSREPYTGGTYAAHAPGQVMRFWRALRRPRWPLIFAGEHTDTHTGDMEGAVRSGRRAAEAVAGRLG